MNPNTALVVTTISGPNPVLLQLAEGCKQHGVRMIVIGDSRSPAGFNIPGVDFFDLKMQRDSGLSYASICPERHYARKNIGYLLACRDGAEVIIETDDDNLPRPEFWQNRTRRQHVEAIEEPGWLNVYRYFSDKHIWPRGLPLSKIQCAKMAVTTASFHDCPIQQGLVDENPDVDAIFRLTRPLPFNFSKRTPLALKKNVWCPFNSQNTSWFREAFPLMYLPAKCSFRMTDIWRSFIAQRLAWEMDWTLLFHNATLWQARNEHDLMRDFNDEISGYLNNEAIAEALSELNFDKGAARIGENLRVCYEKLGQMGLVGAEETALLEAWTEDISSIM
jgi:hypothetical protein